MAEQNTSSYPMISEKNWWTIRDKFKASVPSSVTPNYIKTLLTMSSNNSAVSNVISPMKRIGLISEDNKPTSLANAWRLDDKYREVCNTIIKDVYPDELLDLFPEDEVDRSVARNWFMSQGVGQGAADKMVALFILLKSGEIRSGKTTSVAKGSASKKEITKEIKTVSRKQEAVERPSINTSPVMAQPNLHIDLQIHISPESTEEQIEAIFSSMAKYLYGANK